MGRMSKQVKGGKHQPYHTAQFWAGMPTHGKKKSAPTEKGKKGKTKSLSFRYMTSIFNIEYCNQGIAYSQQDEGGGAEETPSEINSLVRCTRLTCFRGLED